MKRILVCYMLLTTFLLILYKPNTQAQSTEGRFRPNIFNAAQFNRLSWRNIGPFRGGRAVAVTGVKGAPLTYYMGTTGGGLWKTDDGGLNWTNISDGYFNSSSVGAIAVADTDPNIIYVGMGEHPVRGVMTSAGDGVYKSSDGGNTWMHIGLIESQHISSIQIHPTNPDIVYVGVQGALYGPSEERGVFYSENGGITWTKSLFLNETTGTSDLVIDSKNPRVLYAGMWDHQRKPWQIRSGGEGSGLYKSMDGGKNWKKLCKGLPNGMGKIGITVSQANSKVLYANIEAENGGVFRSDNSGENWVQTSNAPETYARAWYYTEIFADPVNEDIVYVLNEPFLKSIDGGRTFETIATPHSDQHHIWINPSKPDNFILANDGGACITYNGGKSWSTQSNQPTGQFYRVITDNKFPYSIYGGQQDNTTIAIPSRTSKGGISARDWHPVSGCESGFIALDPNNPELIYGGCYQGYISTYDEHTQTVKDIMHYPEIGLAQEPKDLRYRFNWNAPIVAQPQDPSIIYHAANVVLQTKDGGISWEEISPDLTRDDLSKQGLGGIPFINEGAGAENYNTLSYLACSPHTAGTIWVGSDDGLVHITQNDGKSWKNITPPALKKQEALINSIEVSPHDPASAYVVVTRYKFNDFKPYIYYTNDFGKNWTTVTKGIEDDHFVRVVREDKKVPGLLYAGTEKGMYISFNHGRKWHQFQLNLPNCPITDLTIQDNDLVAATAGRAFWILDDLGAIQQSKGELGFSPLFFEPKATVRFNGKISMKPGQGQNPLNGVIIDYYLPENLDDKVVKLEIFNAQGTLVRSFKNSKDESTKAASFSSILSSNAGLNRFNWDMTGNLIPVIANGYMYGSYRGHRVAPGLFTLKLITPNDTLQQVAQILPDPRIKVELSAYKAQEKLMLNIEELLRDIHISINRMKDVKSQVAFLTKQLRKAGCEEHMIAKGERIQKNIEEWESQLVQVKQRSALDVINYPSKINAELASLLKRVDAHTPTVTQGALTRFKDLQKDWKRHRTAMMHILTKDIVDFNQMYKDHDVPALVVPN